MNSFRIIALRVLKGCESHIRRALKEDVTYFLCNDYKDQYDKEFKWTTISKRRIENGELPKDFFSLPPEIDGQNKREHTPTINISAIVGKNGDGKSSLVELMLRIIYNLSKAYRFKEDQKPLTQIQGIKGFQIQGVEAILYYEIEGELYDIRCSNGKTIASFAKQGDKESLKHHQNQLFYTIVANYSIYAYNSRNFELEGRGNECWIDGVFHKNDSYQMPLVLNPMRTEGNFDVNLEEDLCRQRLMSLFVDKGYDSSEVTAREINDKKIATGFAFNLEKDSKLETSTLRTYFQSTWKSTALKRFSDFLNGFLTAINGSDGDRRYAESLINGHVRFWLRYSELWYKYSHLFELAKEVMTQLYKENDAEYNQNENTDLQNYLEAAKYAFAYVDSVDDEDMKIILASLETVSNKTSSAKLTGLQFQRLVLIIDVCEFWYHHNCFFNHSFAEDIEKYLKGDKEREEGCRARLYVIYKTISIFSQYDRFRDIFDINWRYFYLFDDLYDKDGNNEKLKQCFESLFTDEEQQHIEEKYDTLKLRQTINFLRYQSFKTEQTKVKQKKNSFFGFGHFVTFDKLHDFIDIVKEKEGCSEETIALLPPPIFEGEILIEEGHHTFRMSDLSSGELQLLNSISTFIYHLHNLNYHLDSKGSLEYSYVNLILEEVELYFHPEYQRQYVYRMMRWIEQVKLDNIKAINIIMLTHSPFVLTDIPKNNVLFLQKGEPVHVMQENTFGANIHALLQNGFFLAGVPMGEFAKKKISKMFERLHKGDYSEKLFEEIKLVSEPLLKTQLYQLFRLNRSLHSTQYNDLLNRIKQLEDKLDGDHKNTRGSEKGDR